MFKLILIKENCSRVSTDVNGLQLESISGFKQKSQNAESVPSTLNCSLFITKVNFMANKFITVVMLEGLPLIKLTQGLGAKLVEQGS